MRFLQSERDFCIDILPAHAESRPRSRSAPATKKIFEEIAKPGGTSTRGKTVAKPIKSRAGVLPARRRRKIRTGLPVRSKLVVPFALVGIGQNFICLIYLFESFLG